MIFFLFFLGDWVTKIKSTLQNKIVESFIKNYLGGLLSRLNGYKTFIGVVVLLLSIGNSFVPVTLQPYVTMLLEILTPHAPNDIPQVNTGELVGAFLIIWGVISKFLKYFKGVPTVPTIVVPDNHPLTPVFKGTKDITNVEDLLKSFEATTKQIEEEKAAKAVDEHYTNNKIV